jgi:hypothetical protein
VVDETIQTGQQSKLAILGYLIAAEIKAFKRFKLLH